MVHRTNWGVRFLFASTFAIFSQPSVAGLSINDSPTSEAFRAVLNGPALQLENLKFIKGVKGQYGTFVGGTDLVGSDPALGIPDGIYLSTGSKDTILGPNDSDKYTYNTRVEFGDADLTAITENAIFDPVIIEFDLIPEGDQVNFLLVFGSEEYPEYVCSKFNDVFGLFVSGPGINGTRNAAMMPGGEYPIAVNNVNTGMKGAAADGTACNLSNSIYFVDNGNGEGAVGTQLDGFSRPLTASLDGLQPGKRYRVKLALADAGDQAYDSAAFFKWLTSTSSEQVDLELSAVSTTDTPAKGAFLDLAYTVTNTSSQPTRLVEVGIELPADIVLVSDDADGNFNASESIWQVGDLQGGEQKTLNLRVSVGNAQSYQIASEILYAFNEDPDSTPYNRLSMPKEDDTAILKLYPVSNNPPEITHADSALSASISYPENETRTIVDLDAKDVDGENEGAGLSWVIAGGDDAGRFTLSSKGELKLTESPNHENPLDTNKDNNYVVDVKVCDSRAECDVQSITVRITDVAEDEDGDGVPANIEDAIGSDPTKPDTDGDGIDDKTEIGTDYDNPKDSDADGTPDVLDADDDGDGILTKAENYNAGSPADDDTDADGVPDYLDADDDGDSVLTKHENYNGGTAVDDDSDNDGTADYLDADDDDDGLLTKNESPDPNNDGNPSDAIDTDNDGMVDYLDTDNENAPRVDNDDDGLTNEEENTLGTNPNKADTDGDGIADGDEVGDVGNPLDTDNDGIPNALDSDDDNDGILTIAENYNGGTSADDDTDADGKPDYLDADDDNDSIFTRLEDYNGNGAKDDDSNSDGIPDYLDVDDDGDGLLTKNESPDPNNDGNPSDAIDTDNDGMVDYLDTDNENAPGVDNDDDGLTNEEENTLGTNPNKADTDGDGIADGDEVGDVGNPLDTDNDGIPNALDSDDDNDGILTIAENYNGGTSADDDTDADGKPDYLDADDDNDSILTRLEDYNGNGAKDDDSDDDGTADYLDADDDDDGLLTKNESPDPNNDGNPSDAIDTDKDGVVDYLDTDNENAPGADNDDDGLSNEEEKDLGTDPDSADTDGDGVVDGDEVGDVKNPLDTDADGTPDVLDDDDDGDGVLTQYENYNGGTPVDDDTDKDGIADYLDTDDDGDGKLTKNESPDPNGDGNPSDAVDTENDGVVNYLDIDDENAPGADNDDDGLTNEEEYELGTNPDSPDTDGDGIDDATEVGSGTYPTDTDFDHIPDVLDPDDDNDGILTVDENYNGGTPADDDSDQDGKPDYRDDDDDNDSIITRLEDYNGNSALDDDSDSDGTPDYLDTDDDGDTIFTWLENYNSALPLDDDTDGDDIPDYLDADDDGDGLLTAKEFSDPNGNGNPDDGVDSDNDGKKDYLDADDDGDGKPTISEMSDPNGDGDPADAVDADLDGLVEYLDPEFTPYIRVKLRTMLQGAYDYNTGSMHNKLQTEHVLPMEQPYSKLELSFGYGSVGNAPPFGYQGNEVLSEAVLAATGNDAVVDWLLIEVRDSDRPTNVLAATTAVVQSDGDVVTPDTGSDNVIVSGVAPGDHYLVIRHRSHLGVMTATPVTLRDDVAYEYDFASADLDVYGHESRVSFPSHEAMWVGDLNNSASIISEGPGSDMSVMLGAVLVAPANLKANANFPLVGYYASDLNLDGKTVYTGPDNDTNLLIGNVLLHPDNSTYQSNFVIQGSLP